MCFSLEATYNDIKGDIKRLHNSSQEVILLVTNRLGHKSRPSLHFNTQLHSSLTSSLFFPAVHTLCNLLRNIKHKSNKWPQLSCHTPTPFLSPIPRSPQPPARPFHPLDPLPIRVHQMRQKSRVASSMFPHHPPRVPWISCRGRPKPPPLLQVRGLGGRCKFSCLTGRLCLCLTRVWRSG